MSVKHRVTTPGSAGALVELISEYLLDKRVNCSPKTISIYRDALADAFANANTLPG